VGSSLPDRGQCSTLDSIFEFRKNFCPCRAQLRIISCTRFETSERRIRRIWRHSPCRLPRFPQSQAATLARSPQEHCPPPITPTPGKLIPVLAAALLNDRTHLIN
jgi:hypothetical protein